MVVFEPGTFREVDSDGRLFVRFCDVVNNIVCQNLIVFVTENGRFLQKIRDEGKH